MSGWEGFTTVIGTVLGSVAFPGVGTFVGGMIGRELGRDHPAPPQVPDGGHSMTPDDFKKLWGLDAIPPGGAGQQDKGKAADAANASTEETARALARLAELDAKTQATLKEIENAGEEGRKALDEIQKSIDDKMKELGPRMNTEEGRKEFREFIIEKLTKAKEVIAKNNQLAEDKAREAAELTKGYGAIGPDGGHKPLPETIPAGNTGPSGSGGSGGGGSTGGGDAPTTPAAAPPAGTATATGMPFGSGMPFGGGMPMPSMPSMGGGGMPGIGDPLGGLSGLGGLGSGSDLPKVEDAASHSTDDKGSSTPGVTDPGTTDGKGGDHKGGEPKVTDGTTQPASATGGTDTGATTDTTTHTGAKAWSIELPDQSTATARNAIGADVTKDVLTGTAVADAYLKKDITLPPVGTPIIDSVSPSLLKAGDVGMWKDHYVMSLGDGKVWVSGQVQKLESLSSGPDFLGWFDPTAKPAGNSAGEPSVK